MNFRDHTYRWLDLKRFELSDGVDSPEDALSLLLRHVRYRDHYVSQDSHERPTDSVHGPYQLDLITTDGYNEALDHNLADPILLLGLFVLDFLAIHPVPDGNGRVSRLLTAHEMLRMGYAVVRYVSVEQLIFDSKNSYYDALEASQRGWHQAAHDVWPWLRYFTTILAEAYETFEARVAGARTQHGSKADRAREWAMQEAPNEFRFAEAVAALPGISSATIRAALNSLRDDGLFAATRGASATWRRL